MQDQSTPQLDPTGALSQALQNHSGDQLDAQRCAAIAHILRPYVERSHLSFTDAVAAIVRNYLADGERVTAMLADPNASEWQDVLAKIITWATCHSLYPHETEATASPDLDAYDDVRKKLASYNFEAPLDTWITVTVTRRLHSYWRSHSTLRAGGSGTKSRKQRLAEQTLAQAPPAVAVRHCSLDAVGDDGRLLIDTYTPSSVSVEDTAEANEIQRVVTALVEDYATEHADPLLIQIWNSVVEQHLKLGEMGQQFDLSLWQVYRRVERLRRMLREDHRVRAWFELYSPYSYEEPARRAVP